MTCNAILSRQVCFHFSLLSVFLAVYSVWNTFQYIYLVRSICDYSWHCVPFLLVTFIYFFCRFILFHVIFTSFKCCSGPYDLRRCPSCQFSCLFVSCNYESLYFGLVDVFESECIICCWFAIHEVSEVVWWVNCKQKHVLCVWNELPFKSVWLSACRTLLCFRRIVSCLLQINQNRSIHVALLNCVKYL